MNVRDVAIVTLGFLGAAALVSPVCAAQSPPRVDTSGVNLQPQYPASALSAGERGAAVLQVRVNPNGEVEFIRPLLTSGFEDLDRAAIAGVLSWHFVPAVTDGKNVARDSVVQIGFEPPTSSKSVEDVRGAPTPAGDFLPQTFRIEAERGKFDKRTFPAACANGKVTVTIRLLHAAGPAASEWAPSASLGVRTSSESADWIALFVSEVEYISPPEQYVVLSHNDASDVGFSRSHLYGSPETLTLAWDSGGLVTATVGSMETHQARLRSAPTVFYFTSSSGAAEFSQPTLVCTPG